MPESTISKFSQHYHLLKGASTEKSTLIELKSLVESKEKQDLVNIGRKYSLQPIFECLNAEDEEKVDLSCFIIYNILKHMKAKDCFNTYGRLILQSLCLPSPRIKTTFLNFLNDLVDEKNVQELFRSHLAIMIEACNCVGNSDATVARNAINYFTRIGENAKGREVLYSGMILAKFREVMSLNDIARFRVYEIASAVSRKSPEGLEATKASGLLTLLLEEVRSTDTLLQLNALEILSSIGMCPHGNKYLEETGVIDYLTDKILKSEDEPMSFVLLPGLIEFFGNICKVAPEDFIGHHPEVINLLFSSLETTDEVVLGVIYSTISKIGSTVNGKIALNNQQDHMEKMFSRVGALLSRKNDATVSVMHSLTELFTINAESSEEISEILFSWYNYIGPDPLKTVVNLTKLPFIELRLSALTLLKAFAKQPWGAEKIARYPGMIEYLTDRSTEVHKDCKSAKYDIVCSLIESTNIESIVSSDILGRLKNFVLEGPFYVPTVSPEMMTEGAS